MWVVLLSPPSCFGRRRGEGGFSLPLCLDGVGFIHFWSGCCFSSMLRMTGGAEERRFLPPFGWCCTPSPVAGGPALPFTFSSLKVFLRLLLLGVSTFLQLLWAGDPLSLPPFCALLFSHSSFEIAKTRCARKTSHQSTKFD